MEVPYIWDDNPFHLPCPIFGHDQKLGEEDEKGSYLKFVKNKPDYSSKFVTYYPLSFTSKIQNPIIVTSQISVTFFKISQKE